MNTELADRERLAWLRLARTQSIGPVTFAALIARFGSASEALEELPRLARRGGGDAARVPSDTDAKRELDAVAKFNARLICSCETGFPSGLAVLDPPPPVLTVTGRNDLLSRDMVAIVGARNASTLGRRLAASLARDLGAAGLVIASGLARGIDTAAHEASLSSGTCAVMAGGVDIVYPPENRSLYDRITAEGVILSEMRIGQSPQARHFPRRNRIISGLARGTVVVEAAEGSGSLITANDALEQNREVFAVPGSPLDPRARGTNRLIREGAVLTETAEDILAVLRPMLAHGFGEPEAEPFRGPGLDREADQIRAVVEEALGPAPADIDDIIRQTGAPAAIILTVLLELELAGRVARHAGNKVAWA